MNACGAAQAPGVPAGHPMVVLHPLPPPPPLARLVTLRGRVAMTSSLLAELAAAPAGSAERVRIALAWLAASR